MANYSTAQLRSMASAAATKYGVDPKVFLAQINQESGFNPNAKSGAGAMGIAQFMPGTAASYHIDPMDPAQALDAAARYDSSELKAFGGDYHKALAAYNAGAGNADKWNDPNFAHGQTYNYVRSILAAAGHTPAATSKGAQVPSGATGGGIGGAANSSDLTRQLLMSSLMAQTSAFASGQQAPQQTSMLPMMQLLASLRSQAATPSVAAPSPRAGKAPSQNVSTFAGSTLPFVGVGTQGLKSNLVKNLSAAVKAAGGDQIKLTSGYRSPEHNQAVGGVSHSNHLTGDAVDGYARINGQWVPLGVALKAIASKFGLRSGDQPGFFNGGTDPVHVDDGANVR